MEELFTYYNPVHKWNYWDLDFDDDWEVLGSYNTNRYMPSYKDVLSKENNFYKDFIFIKEYNHAFEIKEKIIITITSIKDNNIIYNRFDFGIFFKNGVQVTTHTVTHSWAEDYLSSFTMKRNEEFYLKNIHKASFYFYANPFNNIALNKFFNGNYKWTLDDNALDNNLSNKNLIYVVYNHEIHRVFNSARNRALVEKNFKKFSFNIGPCFNSASEINNDWIKKYICHAIKSIKLYPLIRKSFIDYNTMIRREYPVKHDIRALDDIVSACIIRTHTRYLSSSFFSEFSSEFCRILNLVSLYRTAHNYTSSSAYSMVVKEIQEELISPLYDTICNLKIE